MEELSGHLLDIVMTLLGSAILGLIGFVWKISHKVADLAKQLDGVREVNRSDMSQTRRDLDYLISKVDNHNDKMYSIVKNLKD